MSILVGSRTGGRLLALPRQSTTIPPVVAAATGPRTDKTTRSTKETVAPVRKHRDDLEHGGTSSMPARTLPGPERILTLIEGGYVIPDDQGPGVIIPLTADPGYRDPECGCDPSGTEGHVCQDMYNQPIRRYTPCHIWARKQIIDGPYWDHFGPEAA